MITEEQRQQRMLGIGGSDMPIILGLSRYKTPYQLYLEKKGIVSTGDEMTPVDNKMTNAQEMGNILEPVVRDIFAKSNGVTIETPDTIIHPILNFMRANIDGYIVEWDRVLEIKTSGNINEWGEEGSDIVPLTHLVQVAHYNIVLPRNDANLATLIGHYGFWYRQYKYIQDYELEKIILDAGSTFWDCVQKGEPPPPVNQKDLRLMYPRHNQGKQINLSDDVYTHFNKLTEVKAKMKELQEIEEESRFKIMEHMKDGECLVDVTGRPLVTWKTNKRGARTFLLKGEKL